MRFIKHRRQESIDLAAKIFNERLKREKEDKEINRLIYFMTMEHREKEDSLYQIVLKKFPKGETNLQYILKKMQFLDEPDEIFKYYNLVKTNHPDALVKEKEYLNSRLAIAYRKQSDYQNFEQCLSNVKNKNFLVKEYNEAAFALTKENKELLLAKKYSEKSLTNIDTLITQNSTAPENWQQELIFNKGTYLDTYAFILSKLGDKKQALASQQKAVALTKGDNPEINQRLVQFLIDDNQPREAMTKAEEFILAQKGNEQIDSLYKMAYITVNGNNNGLETTFARIKGKEKEEYIKQLKTAMIDIPAPDLTLKDLNGNTVKLSDLRGSIVVLDFWATWCGWCIKAFPAMQQSLQELKDKSVKFLFINTMENSSAEKRTEQIKRILENKKVTNFHVLLDEKEGIEYIAVSKFKVNDGIPAKYVIDENGKIRFISIGYDGDEKLIKELKTLVEILNEKK